LSDASLRSDISFRDPDSIVRLHEERVLRLVRPHAASRFQEMLSGEAVSRLMRNGDLAGTWRVPRDKVPADLQDSAGALYEHERIPFISYPIEWAPAMLARAAEFTLETSLTLLASGLLLKDATPGNVLFRGARPVFVDLSSIVARAPGTYLWLARHQFETCFLLPLIANVEAGIPLAWSLQDWVSGLQHAQLARILGWRAWLRPRLVTSVALPAALSGRKPAAGHLRQEPKISHDERAKFVLQHNFERLLASVRRYERPIESRGSHWKGYQATRTHYSSDDLGTKRGFVEKALARHKPAWTLDVGCNTGEFSILAAAHSSVIAIDQDEAAVGSLWQRAHRRTLNIQPLVVDFARPTPASGWRNGETRSFLERCTGRFDCVLMLAVLHHLRVTSGVPLAQILEVAARLCRRHLVVEFVPASDPMFALIARGREPLYDDYTREHFEELLADRFETEATQALSNGRVLYLARRRDRAHRPPSVT
jgi:SAM-dependent methyltransferase